MKKISKAIALMLVALLATAVFAGCATTPPAAENSPTQNPGTETPAVSAPPAEASIFDDEMKLVVYSPATEGQINAVIPLFEEKYGIDVEIITGGTGELLSRIDAEGANPYADVVFGGGESSYAEYKHIFQEYVSTEDANLLSEFRNTLGYCTNYNVDSAILLYNTDLIGDIQINSYNDLLNEALKGKIAMPDPTASSSALMHIETILTDFGGLTLENETGWDMVAKLVANLDGKLMSGSSAAWKAVADGEMVVALSYEEAGITLMKNGAPVQVVYPAEGTVFTPSTSGVIANCTHPKNAKLFIDFILSVEVQNIFCNDLDVRPVRDDVTYPPYFMPASDVKTVDLDQAYINEHKAEIVEKYTDIFQSVYPG